MHIKEQEFIDVPLFELTSFVIYEINRVSLNTMMLGSSAVRYSDRYRVENMNFTDNSKKYIANMKANSGVYKDDIVTLVGDVVYSREDGLTFETKKAIYDKKTTIVQTDDNFILYRGSDTMSGSSIIYNNRLNTIKSKNIVMQYQLSEKI